MANASQSPVQPHPGASTVTVVNHSRSASEVGVDAALLVSALFLQRFSLSLGNSLLSLDVVPTACVIIYQFAAGRLVINYDRLLWFIALGFVATCSLYFNFSSKMLSSYSEFIVMYFLFTLSKRTSTNSYRHTLQVFQFLVMTLSALAIAQFFAQFVVDGRQIILFFGIVPDFLFASYGAGGVNTIIPLYEGTSLIKSNGIFLAEPSTLSQMTALAILIEILEFARLRYLCLLALGYLLSYSGTGLMMLLVFVPLASLVRGRAMQYALLLLIFVFGLVITGIVDLSVFLGRLGEFEDTHASGHARFIVPFSAAADFLHSASPSGWLFGNGPGTTAGFLQFGDTGGFTGTWLKLLYEYGFIGSFIFILFLVGCCRRTPCPSIILAAIFFSFALLGGYLLGTPFLTIMIVLLTLSGPMSWSRHVETKGKCRPPFVD